MKLTLKERTWVTVTVILALAALAAIVWGVPVGERSRWGVVVTECAWCGATNDIEVHHVYMQSKWPELAMDTNNMICLCRTDGKGCHWYLGHGGRGWGHSVTNLWVMIAEGKR